MAVEARVDGAQCGESTNEQRRSDQQDQRQRDFADHQQGASLLLMQAGSGTSTARFEGGGQIGAGNVERGDESE